MIIDSHQHFWKYDPAVYGWIDESMSAIRRDFMPADLKPVMHWLGVDGTIAVQADQSEVETRFLLGLADEHPFIKAVVGWTDLRADDVKERLARFSRFEKLAGFRHILQGEEPGRMLELSFMRGIDALAEQGFTYDILIFPRHLDAAVELVNRFPGQPFVVDHMAKPDIKGAAFDGWAEGMKKLAEADNVSCKVSGLVTEADWNSWGLDDLRPYLDLVFESFGTKRLMFGSDWPVCLLAGSYEQVLSAVKEYLSEYTPEEKSEVLGGNALRFYDAGRQGG